MRSVQLIAAGFVLAAIAPASATGNVRIVQRDDSVQTYTGVNFKVADRTLTLTSADKVSTVSISGADCSHLGQIVHCEGGGFSLLQDGKKHIVPFQAAKFYFNLTDKNQSLPLSTKTIAPHSVVFAVLTAKGTHITGSGTLDEEPQQQ